MEWSVYLDRPARKFYERHVKYRLILDRVITMLKEDPYRAIYKKPKGKCRDSTSLGLVRLGCSTRYM